MKTKDDVILTLKTMLDLYDTYRVEMNKHESIKKTLDAYYDFYDWIYNLGEYKK